MRIYFIGQKGIPAKGGGIERYVEDLSVRLVQLGHDVNVYTRPHYTPKELEAVNGIKLVSLPTIKTKHLDAITHCFLASLDVVRRRADVVYYQNIGPALTAWIPKLFSRAKVVSILQSQDYHHQKWGRFAKFSLRLGELVMCLVSDEVVVVTEAMQKYVLEKYGRTAHLIPNGANLPTAAMPARLIKAWGLGEGNYIVSISRLIRHKGIHYLVEAYNRLETDKKLVIVGDGSFTDDYVTELKAMAKGNDKIMFLGNQSGKVLDELYANAYLFVQPSEAEGLSLALLEAMANGRAVLVSDIIENKEAIGETGLTFKNKDVDELAAGLSYLLENEAKAKEMGSSARKRVEERFDWMEIAKQLSAVFAADRANRLKRSGAYYLYKYLCNLEHQRES